MYIAAQDKTTYLRQSILDIDNPLRVEHMALWRKLLHGLLILELDQRREDEQHIAPFVHDGRMAEVAAHFAGQLVLERLVGRVVPLEVVVALCEVDVVFA
jgi:hypothetical protein